MQATGGGALRIINTNFISNAPSEGGIFLNSFEKLLPYIGFYLPERFYLNSSLCLNPNVLPAVGELFNFNIEYLLNKISR